MVGLKHTAKTVMSVLATRAYQLKNLVTGAKPVHVVVCGPDDQGARALLDLVPSLFATEDVAVVWGQALWAESVRARLIVSWDPDDASRVGEIEKTLSTTRNLVYLLAVADPLVLVSERSAELPHHFSQGADYRLHVDGATRSFTEPGVVSRSRDVLAVTKNCGSRALVIRREESNINASEALRAIVNLVKQNGGPGPATAGTAPPSFPVPAPLSPYSGIPDRVAQVESQRRRFPELDDVAKALGYQAPPPPAVAATVSARGLIIAFHTPDKIYEAEAERLRRSLDGLGLDYEISVVEPESNWVRTTLLKPTWIAPAREKHRGPLLYIDVDAYVHEDPWPSLDGLSADMGAVVYPSGELNSATLWINDTPEAQTLLSLWSQGSGNRRESDNGNLRQVGDDSDQGVLRLIVEEEEESENPRFRFARLQPNFATIFDRLDAYRYGAITIEQLQVSREITLREKRLARRRQRLGELGD
jgi:hypothetical protein